MREGPASDEAPAPSYLELVRTFLGISLLGFGGPSAHLALMLDEVVERRRWLSRERFLELMAVTNLLPGPNSSEVAIHIGYAQRGWPGALATGLAFLLPTFVIVTGVSALYFRFGTLPRIEPLFWGLKPVIVAIVLAAGIKIGRTAVRSRLQGVLAFIGAGVSILSGQAIIAAMALAGAWTWWVGRSRGDGEGSGDGLGGGRAGGSSAAGGSSGTGGSSEARGSGGAGAPGGSGTVAVFVPFVVLGAGAGGVGTVFWTHLWIGSVLFGGGYVLVALLEPYAVGQYGWLTASQFLDGVALTQAAPGPISTLSAFVGYGAAGLPGAIAGTVGVYLPAFAAVLVSAPRLARLREVPAVQDALTGVVAAAAGAVLGVGLVLIVAGVRDPVAGVLAVVAFILAVWRKIPAIRLVGIGLVVGLLRAVVA